MLFSTTRRIQEACDTVFAYCLEPSSKSSIQRRIHCLTCIAQSTLATPLFHRRISRLVHHRILTDSEEWAGLDETLKQCIPNLVPTRDEIERGAALLKTQKLDDEQIVSSSLSVK